MKQFGNTGFYYIYSKGIHNVVDENKSPVFTIPDDSMPEGIGKNGIQFFFNLWHNRYLYGKNIRDPNVDTYLK